MENMPVYTRKESGRVETGVQVYFKSFCNDWCEEVRDEVIKYIGYEIGDVVREYFCKDAYYKIKEMKNYAMDQFIFQIYFDHDTRTVFLSYDLDKIIRNNYNPIEVIRKINDRLYNNFQRVTNRHLRIVDYYHYDSYQSTNKKHKVVAVPINIETFSYWKCYDGYYRFITGKNLLVSERVHNHQANTITKKIVEINNKYHFNNKETNKNDVEKAFEELQSIYKSTIGLELKPIPDDEVFPCYMDCYYPELENKLK